MYIIDRLNEVILEKYHILIESDVSVFEHTHNSEEARFVDNYTNPSASYTSNVDNLVCDLKTYLLEYIELIAGSIVFPDDLKTIIAEEEQHVGFFLTNYINDQGHCPSVEEFERWTNGGCLLYVHDVAITVSINGSKISNTILYDLIFGGE